MALRVTVALALVAGCARSTTVYEGHVSLAPVVLDGDVYFGTIDGNDHAIRRVRDGADAVDVRWRSQGEGAFGAGLATDRGTLVWSALTGDGRDTAAYRLSGYDRIEIGTFGTLSSQQDWLVAMAVDGDRLYTATRYAVAWISLAGGTSDLSCHVGSSSEEITALAVRDGSVYALAATRNALSSPVRLLACADASAQTIVVERGVSSSTFAIRDREAWLAGRDGLVHVDLESATSERLLDEPVLAIHDVGDAIYAVLGEPGNTRLVDIADPWTVIATGLSEGAIAVAAHRIFYVTDDGLVAVDR